MTAVERASLPPLARTLLISFPPALHTLDKLAASQMHEREREERKERRKYTCAGWRVRGAYTRRGRCKKDVSDGLIFFLAPAPSLLRSVQAVQAAQLFPKLHPKCAVHIGNVAL